ncbi:MAG: SMP-30/gluconolactonase/LRE family protein [Paracoccus sp. (in: a-proteobacteria)]|uniref:SMP-30/gluconolactonase/LRE family protein n=1 Tax=Paracoccus sp. TaxID=267 RepID=UPI0039E6BDEC
MKQSLFDPRRCELGEGAFWHPQRRQVFWFDILGRRLLSRHDGRELEWRFDDHVSAAGWIDTHRLLIASATALLDFNLETGESRVLTPLEADNPRTRSNDGRTDPWGGFWIGTMALDAAPRQGAIYRFHRGELRRLHDRISIPNAICFAPDRSLAYFADTARQAVFRQTLDAEGWPAADPQVFLDFSGSDEFPDGAVTDAAGNFWNARWSTGRLVCHAPDGRQIAEVSIPAKQATCPAFMGEALDQILLTSAAEGLDGPQDGQSWHILPPPGTRGLPEPRIILP